jgi:hypothetical protein
MIYLDMKVYLLVQYSIELKHSIICFEQIQLTDSDTIY